MGSPQNNILLLLEFFNVPFLFLQFSYFTLMTFLLMLSAISLSMLMILLSTLLQNLNLVCGTLLTGSESDLFISMMKKLN